VVASLFAIVFGVFVVALAVLVVVTVTWAVRRDRARWREWHQRRDE
jgi:ABC-type Fe3+ transport system permease subunit